MVIIINKEKLHHAWSALQEFLPGLFDNESFRIIGRGIVRGWQGLRRGIAYLSEHRWAARWGLLAVTALSMWIVYCAPTVCIHELAARHPSEISTVRITMTKYHNQDQAFGLPWEDRQVLLTPETREYPLVMGALENLRFRRYIGEPLARLLPDRDGTYADGLTVGDIAMRLEYLDDRGHAYFTLLSYPRNSYYSKDGWGSTEKYLPVVLKGGSDSLRSLGNMLYYLEQ